MFGGFHLTNANGDAIELGARKTKALFGWLAVNPDIEHPREKIAALLWPDSEMDVARHSLRQALGGLKKVMSDEVNPLRTSKDLIVFNSDGVEVDVRIFDASLARGEVRASETICQLYQGEFMAGCNPRADLYDEWITENRNAYRARAINAICQQLTVMVDRRQFELAAPLATRLINIDPLRESAYRGLMIAYMGLGDNALALRWYRRCEKTLLEELDVLPCLETRALHARLLAAWDSEDEGADQLQSIKNRKKAALVTISKGHQRVLVQAESIIEGIYDHLGGQTILLRGDSPQAKTDLAAQIIKLARPQGFQVCRSTLHLASEELGGAEILPQCPQLSTCLVEDHEILRRDVSEDSSSTESCLGAIRDAAQHTPLLLILENIHTASAQTLISLGRLISLAGEASILLILTAGFGGESSERAWQGAMVNAPLTTIDLES